MGKFGKGLILNHSAIPLYVLETDSGKAVVHQLSARRKSPVSVDADAFKRVDGEAILLHKEWWKIIDGTEADIWPLGESLLVPTSLMIPVARDHFGALSLDPNPNWGDPLTYITAAIMDKRGHVVGYHAEKFGELDKGEAIRLTQAGQLDNVIVVANANGNVFLRTKKNAEIIDNLSAEV